jgi:hypothetical protein
MIRLIEKIGTAQHTQDGALLNFNTLGRQNGALYGCQLVLASPSLITITKGVLVLRGYRVEISADEIFNSVGLPLPTNPEVRYIVLRIDVEGGDATAQILIKGTNAQIGYEIERINGFAEYLMGTFRIDSTNGITNLTSAIQIIQNTASGGQSSSPSIVDINDMSIPTPEIALFKRRSEDYGHLYLKNAMDYNKYQENYEVVIRLYRYIGNMVYRYTSPQTGTKTNYKKTGYIAPKPYGTIGRADIGWRRAEKEKFALEKNLSELMDITIENDPSDLFIKQNAIDAVWDFIDTMFFYEPGTIDSDPAATSKYVREPISTTSVNPYWIRTTRSGRRKNAISSAWPGTDGNSRWHRRNYFRFCYKIVLKHKTTKEDLRVSEKSRDIMIRPYLGTHYDWGSSVRIEQLFLVTMI